MHFKVIRSFHRLLLAVESRVNLEVAYRDDGGGRGVSCRCIRCSHERLHVSLRRLQVSLGRLQVSLRRLHVPTRWLQVSVEWLQGDVAKEGVRLPEQSSSSAIPDEGGEGRPGPRAILLGRALPYVGVARQDRGGPFCGPDEQREQDLQVPIRLLCGQKIATSDRGACGRFFAATTLWFSSAFCSALSQLCYCLPLSKSITASIESSKMYMT